MDTTSAVVGIVQAAGGKLRGRTTLQKLVYLATAQGLVAVDYRPHYYGPYSEEVASTVDMLSAHGFLAEEIQHLGPHADSWLQDVAGDVKAYAYSLTSEGEELAEELRQESPQNWDALAGLVRVCDERAGLSPGVLAAASKVHYILAQAGKPLDDTQIQDTARTFGWSLNEDQIGKVAALLNQLHLVK